MKKKYYGILLAAVIAAGTIGVTAQAAELADTEKLTETANVTDDVNTANSTDASVQAQSDELEVPLVLNQTYTRSFSQVGQKYYFTFTPEETGYYYVDLNFPENMNIHVLDDYFRCTVFCRKAEQYRILYILSGTAGFCRWTGAGNGYDHLPQSSRY